MHNSDVRVRLPKLKALPKRKIKEQVREVEAVMVTVKVTIITKTNALMYAGERIVTERLNVKPRSEISNVSHLGERISKHKSRNSGQILQEWKKRNDDEKERSVILMRCTRYPAGLQNSSRVV